MNKLLIDTTDQKIAKVTLIHGDKRDSLSSENSRKSQATLQLVEKILKKNKISPKEIDEIEVDKGPGSFTGIKVGFAIANGLGFSLNVKVNGKLPGEEEASYT